MTSLTIQPTKKLNGSLRVAGDKSISHRALLCGALADGISYIEGILLGNDCLATMSCLRALGIHIEQLGENVCVEGRGLRGLSSSFFPLDCVRSGTTMRLLAGLLAGQNFDSILTGDEQLLRRPMKRVSEPLQLMGASLTTTHGYAPIIIKGSPLQGIEYTLPVASAQVKSALLLAGLYAQGETTVHQSSSTRDHTERMLHYTGVNIVEKDLSVTLYPPTSMSPLSEGNEKPYIVPGDFSSAAFPLVACAITAQSEIVIEKVGINPTRIGLLDVLQEMGADIEIHPLQNPKGGEPMADLVVKSSSLQAVEVNGNTIVRMIDEFPVFAVAAACAKGVTVVRDARELRVKETDRIATIVEELSKFGVKIEALEDGFVIEGGRPLQAAQVSSHGDHRVAMAMVVAGLAAEKEVSIDDVDCITDSFPTFLPLMQSIGMCYG